MTSTRGLVEAAIRYGEGLTLAQIAAATGLNPNTVQARVHRLKDLGVVVKRADGRWVAAPAFAAQPTTTRVRGVAVLRRPGGGVEVAAFQGGGMKGGSDARDQPTDRPQAGRAALPRHHLGRMGGAGEATT